MRFHELLQKSDIRTEILGLLTLKEIQFSLRSVSKDCKTVTEDHKTGILERLLLFSSNVLVLDLKSVKGKALNGRVGRINGKPKEGRFPIRIDANWLSGEHEVMALKLCNLHPFFTGRNEETTRCPESLEGYSSTSCVRGSHGRLLHRFLRFGQWFVCEIGDVGFNGDLNDFFRLPLFHPVVKQANSIMFDYWKEPPFRCSRSSSSRQYGTALDYIVGLTMFNSPNTEGVSTEMARHDKLWPADGASGKNMIRNFFHCMKTWNEERVTGGFWVTNVYKTGTVMVHLSDLNDPESLAGVYLVKGHTSVVGELIQQSEGRLPGFCKTTILPLYDFWTYDGLIMPGLYKTTGPAFEGKLREHVQTAIYSHTISWRAPSAEQGLWDFENHPPVLPTYLVNEGSHYVMDWHDGGNEGSTTTQPSSNDALVEFSAEELDLAGNIAAMAVSLGGMRKLDDDVVEPADEPREVSAITIRRVNRGFCTILDTRVETQPLHAFHFVPKDTGSYPLQNVLQGVLAAINAAAPLPLAQCILIDDRDILRPLDSILVKAFGEVGLIAPRIDRF